MGGPTPAEQLLSAITCRTKPGRLISRAYLPAVGLNDAATDTLTGTISRDARMVLNGGSREMQRPGGGLRHCHDLYS
jgi:hypothetical protein